jgi:uncharacterized protein (DUF1330 family)
MATYIVGDLQITEAAVYQSHVPGALASIARFGGRVIAGGGSKVDLLEGEPSPEWIFIIEFPTADAARRWYQCDDYQEALNLRLSASHGRVLLIEGTEISTAVPVAGLEAGSD